MHGSKCKQIIQEETNNLCVDGVFNPNEAWALKKKLFPQSSEPPFAVLNENKELVTDSNSILDVMKKEFKFRLRNREISTEYEDLKELKEYLCHLRLKITESKQYSKWEMKHLLNAINKLKNNKCKDPHGHINELYKQMGCDGLKS